MTEYKRGDERIWRVCDIDGPRTSWREVGEIVRCEDCIYWRDEDFCVNPQWMGGRAVNGLIEFPCTFPEDFCSYAGPKEVDDER